MADTLSDSKPFAAVHDHVVVLRPLQATKTPAGLVLPDSAKKPFHYGYAAAVGPKVESINVGDWVMFNPGSAQPVLFDDPNKTMLTVVPEAGVFFRFTTDLARDLNCEMPQFDVLDVLSRSKATAVEQ